MVARILMMLLVIVLAFAAPATAGEREMKVPTRHELKDELKKAKADLAKSEAKLEKAKEKLAKSEFDNSCLRGGIVELETYVEFQEDEVAEATRSWWRIVVAYFRGE